MIRFVSLLAAADLNASDVHQMQTPLSFTALPYTLTILGVIIGVALLGSLVIVVFRRKGKRRHHRHHRHHHHDRSADSSGGQTAAVGKDAAVAEGRRRKWRRRKRPHRPLNPTLAQTGGLPPIRDPNTPPAGL
jgi:hypothetical protein